MKDEDWLLDGRRLPDEVMGYIRKMAVHAVRERGESPEVVAEVFNFNRACIYRWLKQYDAGGYRALESRMAPGASPLITAEMEAWLKHTVLNRTPMDFGYDTTLWTCELLAALLQEEFGVTVGGCAVSLHLKKLGLTYQKPTYQDSDRDPQEVERFLNDKFPRLQRLAEKLGADIGFEDEAGVGIMTRSGRTWGLRGKTPVVRVSMQGGGYNVLSMVTAQGTMQFSVTEEHMAGQRYIVFLRQLLEVRQKPLILLVDRAPPFIAPGKYVRLCGLTGVGSASISCPDGRRNGTPMNRSGRKSKLSGSENNPSRTKTISKSVCTRNCAPCREIPGTYSLSFSYRRLNMQPAMYLN